MKGFVYLLSGFLLLLFLFSVYMVKYYTDKNIIFYQNELLDELNKKEMFDFIVTGLKICAKNSKTKEEFIACLDVWSKKVGFIYSIDDLYIDGSVNTIFFYSNDSLFKNYLKIEYKNRTYIFKNITF